MKRRLLVLLLMIIAMIAFVAGCGEGTPAPKKEVPKAEVSAKICAVAGIGDTLDEWIKDHGKPNLDNGSSKNFRNNGFLVLFIDNRACNITIQASNLKDAAEYVKKMVPLDGKYVSEKTNDDGMVTTIDKEYTSENLKKVIKSNLTGHCTVGEARDSKSKQLIMYVIDCLPTLQETQKSKEAK